MNKKRDVTNIAIQVLVQKKKNKAIWRNGKSPDIKIRVQVLHRKSQEKTMKTPVVVAVNMIN